ncbi:DNA-binding protein, partial [Kingella kingae]|uniref:DNA-binding protein n=1 Tax=Kingella kingae TaxID=504 RepID=UPI0022A7778F
MSWVLSSDLIGLAGMPTTSRGITKRATTENWIKRRKQGVKGNVFEYEIASMPAEVQAAIAPKQ